MKGNIKHIRQNTALCSDCKSTHSLCIVVSSNTVRHRVFDIVFPVPDFIEVNPKQRNQTNNLTLVSASNVLGVTTGDLILYSAEVGEWWRGRHIAEGAFIG